MSRKRKKKVSISTNNPDARTTISEERPIGGAPSSGRFPHNAKITLALAFLILSIFFTYWNIGNCQFINYDDGSYVYGNHHIQEGLSAKSVAWAFTTFHSTNWHPLTWISHMIDWRLFGADPRGHHYVSLLIHSLDTVLLFLLLIYLTNRIWRSAFVAILFALHPLHVESVVWIAERKDVLSTFFMLLTLLSYAYYVKKNRLLPYFLSIVLFMCGLMSKPMLVTLPMLLILLDYWPLNRIAQINDFGTMRRRWGRLIIEKVPFFIPVIGSCIVTLLAQKSAMSPIKFIPIDIRFGNMIESYGQYVWKMFWPFPMVPLYPYHNLSPYTVLASFLAVSLITILILLFSRRNRFLVTGWFWYLITLVPVIGIIQVGLQSIADRYTYIPFIGLFIIVSWAVPTVKPKWRAVTFLIVGIIICYLSIATFIQVKYWKNTYTLFQHTIKSLPDNSIACGILADWLLDQQNYKEAQIYYRKELEIDPQKGKAYNNLGLCYMNENQFEEAKKWFVRGLAIDPDNSSIIGNLIILLTKMHQTKEADEYWSRLPQDTTRIRFLYSIAITYQQDRELEKALEHYKEIIRLKPDPALAALATNNSGVILYQKGDPDGALTYFAQTLKIDPQNADAHNNIGTIYAQRHGVDSAITHFEKAITIDSSKVNFYKNLGRALLEKKNYNEAAMKFSKSVQIDPSDQETKVLLEKAKSMQRSAMMK